MTSSKEKTYTIGQYHVDAVTHALEWFAKQQAKAGGAKLGDFDANLVRETFERGLTPVYPGSGGYFLGPKMQQAMKTTERVALPGFKICPFHDDYQYRAENPQCPLCEGARRMFANSAKAKPAKTPERTAQWVQVCMLICMLSEKCSRDGTPVEMLRSYATEQKALAQAEGYDDTAQYIQHVLDDLPRTP